MNKLFYIGYYSCICIILLLIGCPSAETSSSSHHKDDDEPDTTRYIKVKVNYIGTGLVDSEHQIWVCLFDKEYPATDLEASAYIALHSNSKTATFRLYSEVSYYLRVSYDFNSSGNYHLKSSHRFQFYNNKNIYSNDDNLNKANPIKVNSGQTVEITVNLDDTFIY